MIYSIENEIDSTTGDSMDGFHRCLPFFEKVNSLDGIDEYLNISDDRAPAASVSNACMTYCR